MFLGFGVWGLGCLGVLGFGVKGKVGVEGLGV